jgi:hypothetical protein
VSSFARAAAPPDDLSICAKEAQKKSILETIIPSGAKQGAEKTCDLGAMGKNHTSGAKAHVVFAAFMARLKSCPFKTKLAADSFRSL